MHKHPLSKNSDFDLPTFKYQRLPKAWKCHVSLLCVQYAQWERFVIGIVAVGEIWRSPLPSVPEASVAWTSVCINETCHLHCVGFYISGGSGGGNPKEESISHIMTLCACSCVTQRPNPSDHLWHNFRAGPTQVLSRPHFTGSSLRGPLLYLENILQMWFFLCLNGGWVSQNPFRHEGQKSKSIKLKRYRGYIAPAMRSSRSEPSSMTASRAWNVRNQQLPNSRLRLPCCWITLKQFSVGCQLPALGSYLTCLAALIWILQLAESVSRESERRRQSHFHCGFWSMLSKRCRRMRKGSEINEKSN